MVVVALDDAVILSANVIFCPMFVVDCFTFIKTGRGAFFCLRGWNWEGFPERWHVLSSGVVGVLCLGDHDRRIMKDI